MGRRQVCSRRQRPGGARSRGSSRLFHLQFHPTCPRGLRSVCGIHHRQEGARGRTPRGRDAGGRTQLDPVRLKHEDPAPEARTWRAVGRDSRSPPPPRTRAAGTRAGGPAPPPPPRRQARAALWELWSSGPRSAARAAPARRGSRLRPGGCCGRGRGRPRPWGSGVARVPAAARAGKRRLRGCGAAEGDALGARACIPGRPRARGRLAPAAC